MKQHYCSACLREIPLNATVCPVCGVRLPYTAADRSDMIPGTILNGRYLIGRCLGRGGFGAAYLGLEVNTNSHVTIKEYFPEFACLRYPGKNEIQIKNGREAQFEEYRRNFLAECQCLEKLRKIDGVCRYVDSFSAGGTSYLVTSYLDGETLSEYIQKAGPLPLNETMQYMYRLLSILQQVHNAGFLHRDISPDNIFRWPDSALCLLDFGSACAINGPTTGFTKGVYTAPEQRVNERQSQETDLYAAAVTMFTLLMGREPRESEGIVLEELPSAFTPALCAFFRKATSRDPQNRFHSAQEMSAALARASEVSPGPLLIRSVLRGKKKRKRALLFLPLALLLALIGVVAASVLSGHTHQYTVAAAGKPATCTAGGLTDTMQCAICGAKKETDAQRALPALGHDWVLAAGLTPTCTADGLSEAIQCSRCGIAQTEQRTLPALGHMTVSLPGREPTCTEDGYTAGTRCLRCNEAISGQESLPALGHDPEVLPGIPPTCLALGISDGYRCTRCGVTLQEKEPLTALGHDPETVAAVEPTCTEDGATEYERCARCGELLTEPETIPSPGHDPVVTPDVEPTCTEPGWTGYEECARCGELLTEPEEIPALGHDPEIASAVEPTCTEDGATEYERCARCGELLSEPEPIAALGHLPQASAGQEPTCTKAGWTEGEICARCGEALSEEQVLPALGHAFMTEAGAAPTCEAAGRTQRIACTRCGLVIQAAEAIPALGHSAMVIPGTQPTCTEAGLSSGEICARCGKILREQTALEPLGHRTVRVAGLVPTEGKNGQTSSLVCTRCGLTVEGGEEIPRLTPTDNE